MHRLWFVILLLVAALPAWALESAPVTSKRSTVTLVSETDAVEVGKPFRIGLHFKLASGWHIYSSNPGDAGLPPELHLTLPDGATAAGIVWPTPVRISEGPVMTFSYTGEVLLPLTVTPPAAAGPFPIDAKVDWLVCEKICVPEQGSFHLDLPSGHAAPSAEAPLFAAADARTPRPSPFTAHIAPDGTLSLVGEGLSARTVKDAWFLPAANTAVENGADQALTVGEGSLTLALKPAAAFDPKAPVSGILVIRDQGDQESDLQVTATPGAAPVRVARTGLLEALLFAFLGGVILNLMPCVFPVLAMKAFAIVRLSGAERGAVRAHAASYTLGILVAFGALAGLLLALRAGGDSVGWGFQFQSVGFVTAMAWLLFAVGLNLSGLYSIGGSVIGIGQNLTDHGGHVGSFFTGLLAVLVATPCTAPFMGAAIAAALAAPAAVTIGVFLMMGVGLAAPYVLLALVPGFARVLPKPGRWMDILKQALAFPMYGAAVWLVWVVSEQAGPDGVLAALAGIVLLGLAAWAYGMAQASVGGGRWAGRGVAVIAVLAALVVLTGLARSDAAPGPQVAAADGEEPYSAERLASLRAAGKAVFVNMTASWCVTCLLNERVALSPASVRDAFTQNQVTYLKGDWTREDPAITRYLREHDRDGVPLYVFYPAGGAPPIVLPQILTAGTVLDILRRSGG